MSGEERLPEERWRRVGVSGSLRRSLNINCLLRLQYFIITVLRNLIISGVLSQSLSYVLLFFYLAAVKFFSYLPALVRATSYRLYQLKVCSVFFLLLVRLMIESVL